jgi:Lar family restriction alleviation protein
MTELLSCPFCGGVEHEIGYDSAGFDVQCHSWTCRAKTGSHTTEAEAITAWNRRVVLDELDASKVREDWQDIATAPKDGTYVTVYQTGVLEPSQCICMWDASWNGGWWMACDGKDPELPLRGPEPTHWRPLPPPPHGDAK